VRRWWKGKYLVVAAAILSAAPSVSVVAEEPRVRGSILSTRQGIRVSLLSRPPLSGELKESATSLPASQSGDQGQQSSCVGWATAYH